MTGVRPGIEDGDLEAVGAVAGPRTFTGARRRTLDLADPVRHSLHEVAVTARVTFFPFLFIGVDGLIGRMGVFARDGGPADLVVVVDEGDVGIVGDEPQIRDGDGDGLGLDGGQFDLEGLPPLLEAQLAARVLEADDRRHHQIVGEVGRQAAGSASLLDDGVEAVDLPETPPDLPPVVIRGDPLDEEVALPVGACVALILFSLGGDVLVALLSQPTLDDDDDRRRSEEGEKEEQCRRAEGRGRAAVLLLLLLS